MAATPSESVLPSFPPTPPPPRRPDPLPASIPGNTPTTDPESPRIPLLTLLAGEHSAGRGAGSMPAVCCQPRPETGRGGSCWPPPGTPRRSGGRAGDRSGGAGAPGGAGAGRRVGGGEGRAAGGPAAVGLGAPRSPRPGAIPPRLVATPHPTEGVEWSAGNRERFDWKLLRRPRGGRRATPRRFAFGQKGGGGAGGRVLLSRPPPGRAGGGGLRIRRRASSSRPPPPSGRMADALRRQIIVLCLLNRAVCAV